MRHVILTCRNHPNLRWSTKEIAVNPDGTYNGARNIFFCGTPCTSASRVSVFVEENGITAVMFRDRSGIDCERVTPDGKLVEECKCSPKDLTIAPEDVLVRREP